MNANICAYCDAPLTEYGTKHASTKDHIVSKLAMQSMGITLGPRNIVRACMPCNSLKSGMTPLAMREVAANAEVYARRLRQIAARTERLIEERGLLG